MKTLYWSCEMGAAGDMLMASLYELLPEKEAFLKTMNSLLPGVTVAAEDCEKCGVHGTHIRVSVHGEEEGEHHHHHEEEHHHAHHHHHHHSDLHEIEHLIEGLPLPENVAKDAAAVYREIARAESQVHGVPVSEVHFHEVGALDAVVDVAGVCLAMAMLKPERVLCGPVNVGSGTVQCAHGVLPVPAPATALLLADVPVFSGSVRSELCTPTGAALLRYFAQEFGAMPVMQLTKTGFGMGTKDFPVCNCVRAFWSEEAEESETVYELKCELDDMSPEEIGFARERIEAAGALDVYTLPADMKKNRPGTLLCCLIRDGQRAPVLEALFRHTSTLGVRETACRRYTLHRRMMTAETPLGAVRFKLSEGYGAERKKAEYEDLAEIARKTGLNIREVRKQVE